MGYQIIRQTVAEQHLFAIFSSYTDTIILWDATGEEITEWFVDLAAEQARKSVTETLKHVGGGNTRQVYFQFAMTWDKALEKDREHGGEASTAIAKEAGS